jgi:hypothetical protein
MTRSQETEQDQKARQAADAISGMRAGVGALAAAMEMDPALRGLHITEILDKPIKGDLGEFRKKWNYTDGCELGSELLDGEVGAVVITAEEEGKKKIISIGRTPKEWSPLAGGHSLQAHDAAAGDPGDYMLEIHEGSDPPKTLCYLDEADLRGVVVRNGATTVNLGENIQRGRQLQISGQVNEVVGLLEK